MAASHASGSRRRAAFTDRELIVAVVVIVTLIIAFILFIGSDVTRPKVLENVAKLEIKSSILAIAAYRRELGVYPVDDMTALGATGEHAMSETLVYHVGRKHRSGGLWYGPYMHFKETRLTDEDGDGLRQFPDPWGGLYLYAENASEATPTGVNPKSYDLVSPGPDGELGGTMGPATGYVRAGTPEGKAREKDNISNWSR